MKVIKYSGIMILVPESEIDLRPVETTLVKSKPAKMVRLLQMMCMFTSYMKFSISVVS